MAQQTQIKPSPEARSFFSQIVARADNEGRLTVNAALRLGADRGRAGEDPRAELEIGELHCAGWISPAGEGGWLVNELVSVPFLQQH